jgi:hypothetical protein
LEEGNGELALKMLQALEAGQDCVLPESTIQVEQALAKGVDEAGEMHWLEGLDLEMVLDQALNDKHVVLDIVDAHLLGLDEGEPVHESPGPQEVVGGVVVADEDDKAGRVVEFLSPDGKVGRKCENTGVILGRVEILSSEASLELLCNSIIDRLDLFLVFLSLHKGEQDLGLLTEMDSRSLVYEWDKHLSSVLCLG